MKKKLLVPIPDEDVVLCAAEPLNERQGATHLTYLLRHVNLGTMGEFMARLTYDLSQEDALKVKRRFAAMARTAENEVGTCPVCNGYKEYHKLACGSCTVQAIETAEQDTTFMTLVRRHLQGMV